MGRAIPALYPEVVGGMGVKAGQSNRMSRRQGGISGLISVAGTRAVFYCGSRRFIGLPGDSRLIVTNIRDNYV